MHSRWYLLTLFLSKRHPNQKGGCPDSLDIPLDPPLECKIWGWNPRFGGGSLEAQKSLSFNNQSINQSIEHVCIAPYFANKSEAHKVLGRKFAAVRWKIATSCPHLLFDPRRRLARAYVRPRIIFKMFYGLMCIGAWVKDDHCASSTWAEFRHIQRVRPNRGPQKGGPMHMPVRECHLSHYSYG